MQQVVSKSRLFSPVTPQAERPRLELSGPALTLAFESLVAGADEQGGIERWIDALRLRRQLFQQALHRVARSGNPTDLALEDFRNLCAFMASVRRRISPWLEQPAWQVTSAAVAELMGGANASAQADQQLLAFCQRFPGDRAHRWVRDLGAELLHGLDPERYPLMCRWVWDRQSNSGVLREIWFDEEIDSITLKVADGYDTFIVLREELCQFLTANGVFRDVIWYTDLLCARIYAGYIASRGGTYLRADFSAPEDPMVFTRRMLGLDGVAAGAARARLKSIDGAAVVSAEPGQG